MDSIWDRRTRRVPSRAGPPPVFLRQPAARYRGETESVHRGRNQRYARFPLQRLWGQGKSASADGMKWDMYAQNLMSEFHIRYGGYGGLGYYLVADSAMAKFRISEFKQ